MVGVCGAIYLLACAGGIKGQRALVAYAEEQGHRTIFTLDADFQIYRLRRRQRFEAIPPR